MGVDISKKWFLFYIYFKSFVWIGILVIYVIQMTNTLKVLDIFLTLKLYKLLNSLPNPHKIHPPRQTGDIDSYSLPARGEGWGGVAVLTEDIKYLYTT